MSQAFVQMKLNVYDRYDHDEVNFLRKDPDEEITFPVTLYEVPVHVKNMIVHNRSSVGLVVGYDQALVESLFRYSEWVFHVTELDSAMLLESNVNSDHLWLGAHSHLTNIHKVISRATRLGYCLKFE